MTRAGNPKVTRRALLDAARDVYAERGYDGTSVAQIARRAGMTTGAVYANFESKDDLLTTLLEERAIALTATLAERLQAEGTLAGRIEVLLAWYSNRGQRESVGGGRLTFDLLRQSYDNPAVRRRLAAIYQTARATAGAALRAEAAARDVQLPMAPEALAGLAIALVDGILVQQLVFDGNAVIDEVRAALALVGLLPPTT